MDACTSVDRHARVFLYPRLAGESRALSGRLETGWV